MTEKADKNQNTADTQDTDANVEPQAPQQQGNTTAAAPVENQSVRRDDRRDSAYAVVAGEPAPSAEDLEGLPGYKTEADENANVRTTGEQDDDKVL